MMRAKRKKTFESEQNEGAQMPVSSELESDRATSMVMNLGGFGVDGVGYDRGYDETETLRTEPPTPARRSEDHHDAVLVLTVRSGQVYYSAKVQDHETHGHGTQSAGT
jgi:hypothetical protein